MLLYLWFLLCLVLIWIVVRVLLRRSEAARQKRQYRKRGQEQGEQARAFEEEARRRAEEEWQSQRDTTSRVSKEERNYGEVLGLTGEITSNDVRNQYIKLAKLYHPDRVGEKLKKSAEIEMKKINEAYEYFKEKYGI